MAASLNWISCILDLKKQIDEVETNDTRILALHILADYAVQYVEWWTAQFDEELKLKPIEAAAVGRRLATVLDTALELCNAESNPSIIKIEGKFMMPNEGEFVECVSDLKMYTQMMNRLIGRLPSQNKKPLILQRLQHKVELDCNLLHEIIENGFKGPKSLTAVHTLAGKDIHVKHPPFSDKSEIYKAEWHMDVNLFKFPFESLPLAEAIDIMIQVAKGIQHLHRHVPYVSIDLSSVWLRIKANGTYSVKLVPPFSDRVDRNFHPLSDQENTLSDSGFRNFMSVLSFRSFLWAALEGKAELPPSLRILLDSLGKADPQHMTIESICQQLWVVMEEVLTGYFDAAFWAAATQEEMEDFAGTYSRFISKLSPSKEDPEGAPVSQAAVTDSLRISYVSRFFSKLRFKRLLKKYPEGAPVSQEAMADSVGKSYVPRFFSRLNSKSLSKEDSEGAPVSQEAGKSANKRWAPSSSSHRQFVDKESKQETADNLLIWSPNRRGAAYSSSSSIKIPTRFVYKESRLMRRPKMRGAAYSPLIRSPAPFLLRSPNRSIKSPNRKGATYTSLLRIPVVDEESKHKTADDLLIKSPNKKENYKKGMYSRHHRGFLPSAPTI